MLNIIYMTYFVMSLITMSQAAIQIKWLYMIKS